MNDPTEKAFRLLSERQWSGGEHRESLGAALRREAHNRKPPRLRGLRGKWFLGGALLGGVAVAAPALLDRLGVTTTIDGRGTERQVVEVGPDGAGTFRVLLLEDEPDRFLFELEGVEAPWITFDIEIEDGEAVVSMQEHAAHPIDLTSARHALAEARELARREGGKLWGRPLEAPWLLVEPNARFGISDRPDPEGRLLSRDGLYYGRLPADLGLANTAVHWAGTRWTMVLWPLPAEDAARARLLLHESFHALQPELGIELKSAPCGHLDQLEGRIGLRLEARALLAALGEGSQDTVLDALAFRIQRRASFEGSAALEDGLEVNEGTAEYTGLVLCGLEQDQQRALASEWLRGLATRKGLARSFAYVTGPAWGLLLDELTPKWREQIPRSSFTDLARAAVGNPTDTELLARAEQRASKYGLGPLRIQEEARERARLQRLEEARERYRPGNTLRLPLGSEIRTTFDPNRIEVLEGLGSLYGTLWATDDWGVLDAPGGGLFTEEGALLLAAPTFLDGLVLEGEGWSLELADGWVAEPADAQGGWVLVRRAR